MEKAFLIPYRGMSTIIFLSMLVRVSLGLLLTHLMDMVFLISLGETSSIDDVELIQKQSLSLGIQSRLFLMQKVPKFVPLFMILTMRLPKKLFLKCRKTSLSADSSIPEHFRKIFLKKKKINKFFNKHLT